MIKILPIVSLFFLFGIVGKAQYSWSELGGINSLGANSNIWTILNDPSGNTYAAGMFTNSSGKKYVAKYDGSVWSELGGPNGLAASQAITSICSDEAGNIYAAGFFSNNSGNKYLAKYNGSNWSELGGLNALAANGVIRSICSDAFGNIYAAGQFTNNSGSYYVAKFNGGSWSELGGLNGLDANNYIWSICADNFGNIYAGGHFTNASGNRYVAKFNGNTWSELGLTNGLAANQNIFTLGSDNFGNIYAGGAFTNSVGYSYIAKFNGASWIELGGSNSLPAYGGIFSIQCDNSGNVYAAGGVFNSLGNSYVAKYDGISWSELGGLNGLAANNTIYCISLDASENIYASGSFTNSFTQSYIAKYGFVNSGCTNSEACNYDPNAVINDGSCYFIGDFCDDGLSMTINDIINTNCICSGELPQLLGCTSSIACNYNSAANIDDGSCFYIGDACDDGDTLSINDTITSACICLGQMPDTPGCTNVAACNFNSSATIDDGTCHFIGDSCDDGDANTLGDIYNMNCECDGFTHVDELQRNLSLFPNPASSEVFVSISGHAPDEILIYDGNGSLIMCVKRTMRIDTNALASGLYSLRITHEGLSYEKLVRKQ